MSTVARPERAHVAINAVLAESEPVEVTREGWIQQTVGTFQAWTLH